jgi:hypothetical protein
MRTQVMVARFIALAASLVLIGVLPALAQNEAKTTTPAVVPGPRTSGQNAVEGLDVNNESGKVTLRFKMKEPVAAPPASFSLVNPPRVAFDFPNTVNALGKSVQEVSDSDLKSVRIGESGGRTRVVLNLSRSLKYNVTVEGQNVIITLQSATGANSAAPAEPTHFADAKPAGQPHSVRNIEFKRGRNGEGQVIIDLSEIGVQVTAGVVPPVWMAIAKQAVVIAFVTTMVIRYGLLVSAVAAAVGNILEEIPMTVSLGHWTATTSNLAIAVVLAITLFGFYASRAGQPLFGTLEPRT